MMVSLLEAATDHKWEYLGFFITKVNAYIIIRVKYVDE